MKIGIVTIGGGDDVLQKAVTKAGIKTVAVAIKTFMREECLFKTLDSIEKYMPFPYRIYVADDSKITDDKAYRYYKLEHRGHRVIKTPELPFNSGISIGRNAIIKEITEEYVLMMDDDIQLVDSDSVKKMMAVLESADDIGLVAGQLFHENGEPWGGPEYTKGLRLEKDRGLLYRYPTEKKYHSRNGTKYIYADQVVNFFLAKRQIFNDIMWDEQIRIEYEHMDFFLRLKETKWRAVACLGAQAMHTKSRHDTEYNFFRRSIASDYFHKKHDITRVINRYP